MNTRIAPITISELTENYFEDTSNDAEIARDDKKWMTWVNKDFQKYAGDGKLTIEKFKKALSLKKSFFAERFFAIFDTNGRGDIECGELIDGLRMLKFGTPTQKLKFLFDVFDVDGSGRIDKFELKTVLKSCMEESSLTLCNEDIDHLTDVLFEDADIDNSGEITFDEFQSSLETHPGLIEDLTFSATCWFEIPQTKTISRCSRYCSRTYLKHNTSKIVFILLYIIANLGFGAYAAWHNRNANGFMIAARICGMNLNLNCTLILVLMLRHTLNLVRSTRIGRFLPLDEHVIFHKWIGAIISVYTCIHIGGHIGNSILVSMGTDNLPVWRILFTDITDYGLVDGTAFVTGWIITVILIIMTIFSLPCVRSRIYQVFFALHFLCVPFWILLIFHCKHFWMWIIVPGTIFLAEQIYRIKWIKQLRYGVTYIEKVTLLPCGVIHLEITRPKTFDFQPGDYLYLQIPHISPYEFHPFTISSAPEMKDKLWLHIRKTGNWTNELYQFITQYDPGEDSELTEVVSEEVTPMMTTLQKKRKEMRNDRRKSIIDHLNDIVGTMVRRGTVEEIKAKEIARQKRIQSKTKQVKIRCFLDGPFGTASREALYTEHAILIGAGIGVTPMASILQSILHRIRQSKRKCPECSHCWYDDTPENIAKMKKVDFIWVNRDQRCFEWFIHVLNNLEIEQSLVSCQEDQLVDMHLYMSAATKKTHFEGVGLQMALDLVHRQERKDFFTGLKTKTQPGRPDWDKIFAQISLQKKGKKKVFFCGPVPLADTIKHLCQKYSFGFAKENF